MCGRFNISVTPEMIELVDELAVEVGLVDQYNIAPTDSIPIFHTINSNRTHSMARWWLTPSWAKEPSNKFAMFNARSETLGTSPAFKNSFRHKRCVIPCSSFVEWKKTPSGKQPIELYRDGGVMAFAGLWDRWNDELTSCTIVTTEASESIQPIHNRMPVMLDKSGIDLWLSDTQDPNDLQSLFSQSTPYPITSRLVDSSINNSRVKCPPTAI